MPGVMWANCIAGPAAPAISNVFAVQQYMYRMHVSDAGAQNTGCSAPGTSGMALSI